MVYDFIFARKVKLLDKIKVAAVSYLNARPLIYGIKDSEILKEEMELVEDYPSKIAQMLIDNKVDMGLVPVATIPKLADPYIVSDYVIAATGNVASVCLFSHVPIEKIDKVLLDYQSRTSINLCKVLMKFHWKKDVTFELTTGEYADQINGSTAGVIIGDRALIQRNNFEYIYDFATEWKALTGKPFVFAAWIANKKLPETFLAHFNEANSHWESFIGQIIEEHEFPTYDLKYYYTHNIDYKSTQDMKDGLDLFLKYLQKIEFV